LDLAAAVAGAGAAVPASSPDAATPPTSAAPPAGADPPAEGAVPDPQLFDVDDAGDDPPLPLVLFAGALLAATGSASTVALAGARVRGRRR
jgi:hypothetical protein